MTDTGPTTYRFWQIDAFSHTRYQGNAAAVVFDADALEPEAMQIIARQMNLSETAFLSTPQAADADYRVRIFTPRSELPFAGHPTIAAAHAHYHGKLNAPHGIESLRQECGIGVVQIGIRHASDECLYFITMTETARRPLEIGPEEIAAMLGCARDDLAASPIESCSTGLPWMIVPLVSMDALTRVAPNQPRIERYCKAQGVVGLSAYAPCGPGRECQFRVRSFAPGEGVPEDPVCGSGNGAVALHVADHLHRDDAAFDYMAEQGIEMGYRGRVHVSVTRDTGGDPTVRVGGGAVKVMQGELYI